jgi:hypothetical protein
MLLMVSASATEVRPSRYSEVEKVRTVIKQKQILRAAQDLGSRLKRLLSASSLERSDRNKALRAHPVVFTIVI